ncbi:hypothetical protein PF005_g15045 [Phytophthora fragariae]|uniref:Uncharacterized protein n=1 Tax=Phytophthora fragariae TaxID=53985 RepID=A0A6A3EMS0_9STRA|nr:hypothetical protein PF003_g19828 [Phytophthora fragariae]KAE8934732.1 hypothetical protein PF009_g15293 [Phytophthora fragariae]KAE9004133.1 hypothetical protein PF011_g12589 [Phytophthora fragariae]KAE9103808.1 hypothetical protein PF007_g14270 [Phytophthora fragariae]KAE9104327.1 hypothetical protein PF010_g13423 [Phytophthora fragariae]
MRARCRSSGEDYNLVTQNVKASFDVELLESFRSLRLRKDVADVTEGQIITEIKALLAKVKNDDLPDIKALFDKELVMDLAETDVDAHILAYSQKFKQVVLEHGLEDFFAGDDGEREKCKRLVSCLAPLVLKADVKPAVRWTNKTAKSMQKVYTLVYDKAVAHDRHFQQNKRQRMMAKVKDKSKDSSASAKSGRAGKAAAQPKKTGAT